MNPKTENTEPRKIDITITETLQKVVTVVASNQSEAEQIVSDQWKNSDHILDADHFVGVEFIASRDEHELSRGANLHGEGGDFNMDSENTTNPVKENQPAALEDNEHVRQLLDIMKTNNKDASALSALLEHVNEMEGFIKSAESKIAEMKEQLDTIKEIQDHPFKNILKNVIKTLETKVAEMKDHLADLKNNIIEGSKKAVSAFKEKGIGALSNIASFFRIGRGLENWKKSLDDSIRSQDKSIASIEAFSKEYHSSSRHLKNMARIAIGKKPLDNIKEAGKLSKMIAAPYKAERSIFKRLRGSIDKAINKLNQLDAITAEKKAERAINKKPSLMEKLKINKERAERSKLELKVPERAKAQGLDI